MCKYYNKYFESNLTKRILPELNYATKWYIFVWCVCLIVWFIYLNFRSLVVVAFEFCFIHLIKFLIECRVGKLTKLYFKCIVQSCANQLIFLLNKVNWMYSVIFIICFASVQYFFIHLQSARGGKVKFFIISNY